MKISAVVVLVYAFMLLAGGIMGYTQAHSLPSLTAGIVSSFLLIICALGINKRSTLAYTMAMLITLGLTLFFGYRFAVTSKFMPAGMMVITSALVLITILWRGKRKVKLT